MKCSGKHDTTLNIPRSITFFSATFHVISRKIDFLWDSEVLCAIYNTVFLLTVLNVLV